MKTRTCDTCKIEIDHDSGRCRKCTIRIYNELQNSPFNKLPTMQVTSYGIYPKRSSNKTEAQKTDELIRDIHNAIAKYKDSP